MSFQACNSKNTIFVRLLKQIPGTLTETKPVVLYVDDDEEDRLLLADALSIVAPGHVIETLPDGVAGLEYLQGRRNNLPCLVVVDLNMPGMNGKEMIKQLRADPALQHLAIVAFTTSSNPADRLECAQYGVDMITKPITFNELKETVKLLLTYCDTAA